MGQIFHGKQANLSDRVGDLRQTLAEGQLGSHVGERVTGGLGSKRTGSRQTRVDFNDGIVAGVGVEGKLQR